jgi:ADP-heptose:LPS heptosyltransferase
MLSRPHELPRVLQLAMLYAWHVWVRQKRLLMLVRFGGMGDLICMLASIPGLRHRHPNSWLILITPSGCEQLAASSGLPDATVEADSFVGTLMWRYRSLFFYLPSPPWPVLPDEYNPPHPQLRHLADEFARALGVTADLSAVTVRVPGRARARLTRRLLKVNPAGHPIVILHPGPSWPVREWPDQRWCELAEIISARTGALIIKIGTDLDSLGRVRPSAPLPNTVDWTNQLGVVEIAALLEQASVFVGIDSGPLHIAGILGVPAVGLFGPVSANLRLHPRAQVSVITAKMDCLGCHHRPTGHLHWKTGCPNDIACMREITAQEVFAAVADHLGAIDRLSKGGQITLASRQIDPSARMSSG